MLTALDIQNKEFAKGLRGYSEEDVDAFLDEVIVDYQSIIEKNSALEAQVAELNAKIAEYKSTEGSVLKTLDSAKSLMNDIAQSAEKRAALIVQNAELEASNKLSQAEDNLKRLQSEEASLKNRMRTLKASMKSMLEAELARVEGMETEL